MNLEWTTEKPNKPGMYIGSRPVPGGVRGEYLLRLAQDEATDGNYAGYLWYGPIPEPKEP